MDLGTIIVVIALTALALGAIVGLEIYSRKTQPKQAATGEASSRAEKHTHSHH